MEREKKKFQFQGRITRRRRRRSPHRISTSFMDSQVNELSTIYSRCTLWSDSSESLRGANTPHDLKLLSGKTVCDWPLREGPKRILRLCRLDCGKQDWKADGSYSPVRHLELWRCDAPWLRCTCEGQKLWRTSDSAGKDNRTWDDITSCSILKYNLRKWLWLRKRLQSAARLNQARLSAASPSTVA